MKYLFFSPVGVIEISPSPLGGWQLVIAEDVMGIYQTPELAAGDVFTHTTGHPDWDDMDTIDSPETLSEWKRSF
ncbi:hypothetical protein [Mailhella massiliensis]|uniref:hypothetical protein n=1 Tax=Mailhella massiliensis TaxID=1903261 RepID=UPI00097CF3AC|nr:hypothetical protein [Mailhella massiliensis]